MKLFACIDLTLEPIHCQLQKHMCELVISIHSLVFVHDIGGVVVSLDVILLLFCLFSSPSVGGSSSILIPG